jgi:hypothetical protein
MGLKSCLCASRGDVCAFLERAHFSPDALNGGSDNTNRRSRLNDARAGAQKALDSFFHLGATIGLPLLVPLAAALRIQAMTRWESRLASCLAMVASTARRMPRTNLVIGAEVRLGVAVERHAVGI